MDIDYEFNEYDEVDEKEDINDKAISDVLDNMSLDELRDIKVSMGNDVSEEIDDIVLEGLSLDELKELRSELTEDSDESDQKGIKAEVKIMLDDEFNDVEATEEIEDFEDISEEISDVAEIDSSELVDIAEDEDELQEITPLEDEAISEIISEIKDKPASVNIDDSELFEKLEAGDYLYEKENNNLRAVGELTMDSDVARNNNNQRKVGGEFRRSDDDGGHLIGNRFGGSSELENLAPQNRNLNRGSYKQLENEWADILQDDGKVYVDVHASGNDESRRPDAFYGYYITENTDGDRHWDGFSFTNESKETQEQWDEEMGYVSDDLGSVEEEFGLKEKE